MNLQFEPDELVEVLIDTLPDMTTDELIEVEFAIGVELQERASRVQQLDLFDDAY